LKRNSGKEHKHYAFGLNSLAFLYDIQGRYADAEPLYKRSPAIRERPMARTIRLSPPTSTTWPRCTTTRAGTPTPNRSNCLFIGRYVAHDFRYRG
jgi:hypothetical protein